MENIFSDMKYIKVYIDDIGIFANSEDQIFDLQNQVLLILMTMVSPLIHSNVNGWSKKWTDLDIGLHQKVYRQPMSNKSILLLALSTTTEIRFSSITLPCSLTLLTGKSPFIWTPAQQTAFDVLGAMMITTNFFSLH
jgi:hypothetical protein